MVQNLPSIYCHVHYLFDAIDLNTEKWWVMQILLFWRMPYFVPMITPTIMNFSTIYIEVSIVSFLCYRALDIEYKSRMELHPNSMFHSFEFFRCVLCSTVWDRLCFDPVVFHWNGISKIGHCRTMHKSPIWTLLTLVELILMYLHNQSLRQYNQNSFVDEIDWSFFLLPWLIE